MIDESIADFDDSEYVEPQGTSITLPKFYNWNGKQIYDYDSQVADYSSLEELGEAISKARRALFVLTDKINEYEREEKTSKLKYDREFRREFIKSSEKTDSAKRVRAALKCEGLENEWMKYEQLKTELTRMSNSIRLELQTLQTIANNLRQQLKIL